MKRSKDIWLVIGSDGFIGRTLSRHLERAGKLVLETTRRADAISKKRLMLDLNGDVSKWTIPENISVAFFCAAISSLENCKKDPVQSKKVNVLNTVKLAERLIDKGVFVIFLSTNLVFDGLVPFEKADSLVCPKTEYGRLKAIAEKQLLEFGKLVAVVRFTKIIDPNVMLFKDWIEKLRNNKPIYPFLDMKLSPIPLEFAVNALMKIAERRLHGIVQISGSEDITYADIARYIASYVGVDLELIKPIKASESGLFLESLPVNTTLDTSRMEKDLGIKAPDISESIKGIYSL